MLERDIHHEFHVKHTYFESRGNVSTEQWFRLCEYCVWFEGGLFDCGFVWNHTSQISYSLSNHDDDDDSVMLLMMIIAWFLCDGEIRLTLFTITHTRQYLIPHKNAMCKGDVWWWEEIDNVECDEKFCLCISTCVKLHQPIM